MGSGSDENARRERAVASSLAERGSTGDGGCVDGARGLDRGGRGRGLKVGFPFVVTARDMARCGFTKMRHWLLEVEMGVVWALAGVSIILFMFASIWFIDPALLTLVLQFRQATCHTENSAVLVGISNCSWTSCRVGCTRDVYKCWQVQVRYDFIEGSEPYAPPWNSVSRLELKKDPAPRSGGLAKLYPNVKGCGYPPDLDCDAFFNDFGTEGGDRFDCWVSTLDGEIAMTELNLARIKSDVLYSLVPLLLFILSVLYAFCRLGVFAVCNPFRWCPKSPDTDLKLEVLTPQRLFQYKKRLAEAKRAQARSHFAAGEGEGSSDTGAGGGDSRLLSPSAALAIPDTIQETNEETPSKPTPSSASSLRPPPAMRSGRPPSRPPSRNVSSPVPPSMEQHRQSFSAFRSKQYTAEERPSGPVMVGSGSATSYIVQSSRGGRGDMLLPRSTPSPTFSFGSSSGSVSRLQKRRSSAASAASHHRRVSEQEVLDLSDFDIDFHTPPEDDVASIRNVRTTTGAAASAARVISVGPPSRHPSPISPGNVSGWTNTEAVSNWGSSYGSSAGGGIGSLGSIYGSGKKTK